MDIQALLRGFSLQHASVEGIVVAVMTESSAKEHGLWIPIDSVFDLGTPGPSSLTHFSIDALDDFMGRRVP